LHAWNLDFVEQTTEGSRYVCLFVNMNNHGKRGNHKLCNESLTFLCSSHVCDPLTATVSLPTRWTNLCVS
jgi:hypothetical protein